MDSQTVDNEDDVKHSKAVSSLRSHFEQMSTDRAAIPRKQAAAQNAYTSRVRFIPDQSNNDVEKKGGPERNTSLLPSPINVVARDSGHEDTPSTNPASPGSWPVLGPKLDRAKQPGEDSFTSWDCTTNTSASPEATNFSSKDVGLPRSRPHSPGARSSKSSVSVGRAIPPPVNRAAKPKVVKSSPNNPFPPGTGLSPLFSETTASPFSSALSGDERPRFYSSAGLTQNDKSSAPQFLQPSEDDVSAALQLRVNDRALSLTRKSSAELSERSSGPSWKPPLPSRPHRDTMQTSSKLQLPLPTAHQTIESTDAQSSASSRDVSLPPRERSIMDPAIQQRHTATSNEYNQSANQNSEDSDKARLRSLPHKDHGSTSAFPNIANVNRRLPDPHTGPLSIRNGDETRLAQICGNVVCVVGSTVRVWDISTGRLLCTFDQVEKDVKITAMAFKPAKTPMDEGSFLWLGTNYGDLEEIDVPKRRIAYVKHSAHDRREIVKIHRYQNAMWTIDDGGRLYIWSGDTSGLPSLKQVPNCCWIEKGHSCSLIIGDSLWLACGKRIWVYRPNLYQTDGFCVLQQPLYQSSLGVITSGTVISSQMNKVYFGHADGRISVYSTDDFECLSIISLNTYRITSVAGVGAMLWTTFSIGTICVYDTVDWPWKMKKCWLGHQGHTTYGLSVDRGSLWKTGDLKIMSYGADNSLRFWDGMLKDDWLDDFQKDHEPEFCSFRKISAVVVTWNAGATLPNQMRHDELDNNFFPKLVRDAGSPDIVMFGFQELVDLEDKKLTAKSFLKGNRKKEPIDNDHMNHQHRAWRDYLLQTIGHLGGPTDSYEILQSANMVGLFSCVFIKASQRGEIRNINVGEVKRGMGGLHGNKGAVAVRFSMGDTSFCLVNCHLAAGQMQTSNRNSDIAAIFDAPIFNSGEVAGMQSSDYCDGGDGSMILDHENCILNGDLNYRIDTMGRDAVIRAIRNRQFSKLLDRDQLLVSQRRNPMFSLRALCEAPIAFPPTYKYDVGTDAYDSSEKRRSPAWCDRILAKRSRYVTQVHYQRHDLRRSDHRPVSGLFRIDVKNRQKSKQDEIRAQGKAVFESVRQKLSRDAKLHYLRDTLGVCLEEAEGLI